MTALPIAVADSVCDSDDPASQANHWLIAHHAELLQRAKARHGNLDPEACDEAVAECMAVTTQAAHRAAQRGTLDRLNPFTCVVYAGRQYYEGRRIAGFSSRCVMSEAAKHKRGRQVISYDQPKDEDSDFTGIVASCEDDNPSEIVRRRHDYPHMLAHEKISAKALATLRFLAETNSAGKQTELATELMVSPARITQIKAEIAAAFARYGYGSPLGSRSVAL